MAEPLADGSPYTRRDLERWAVEPPKDPLRGAFARDRARVLHSSALRRLAAKTQVVGPGTDDFVRNRLTHSLEVAQVGRELGQFLGCDPDVVDTACLAHDLGHPPFGHNGESALDAVAAGIGGFEGNAQTLRVLTRLEPKVIDVRSGAPAGLNLTRASLDACTKYPWPRGAGPVAGAAKFGVYAQDGQVFGWLREGAPPLRRCLEAQVMDLADDIAYSVHDVEDAVVGGHVDLAVLGSRDARQQVVATARQWYLPDGDPAELDDALTRLRRAQAWTVGFDGSRGALAGLKDLTSELIGRFIRAAVSATRQRYGAAPLGRYEADVVVPRRTACEIAALKAVAAVYVMASQARRPLYARQREVLAELYDVLAARAPQGLEPPFAADYRAAGDDATRQRVVIDQIASLTDPRALEWHDRLSSPGR